MAGSSVEANLSNSCRPERGPVCCSTELPRYLSPHSYYSAIVHQLYHRATKVPSTNHHHHQVPSSPITNISKIFTKNHHWWSTNQYLPLCCSKELPRYVSLFAPIIVNHNFHQYPPSEKENCQSTFQEHDESEEPPEPPMAVIFQSTRGHLSIFDIGGEIFDIGESGK